MIKRGIAFKLTASLVLVLIVSFGALMAFDLHGLYRSSLQIGEIEAEQQSLAFSRELLRQFDETIAMLETLRVELLSSREDQRTNREAFVRLLEKLLEDKNDLLGLYTMWEPGAYDGKDADYRNAAPYHDETGRFLPYVVRVGKSIAAIPIMDYTLPGLNDYYEIPKSTRSFALIEPYEYEIDGEMVTMTSFVLPIIDSEGRFLGIVGADYCLDNVQADISLIRPKGGYASLISAQGIYLANGRYRDQIMRTYIDRADSRDTLKQAHDAETVYKIYTPGPAGDELHLLYPIPIKGERWFLETILSKNNLLAEFDYRFRIALGVAAAGILLAASVVAVSLRLRVVKRLDRLRSATETAAAGDWSQRLSFPSGDEFEQLARSFNFMIDSRRDAEEQALYQAHHDPLTDLPNRLKLDQDLDRAIKDARRTGASFALLLIDLDQFEWFNDTLDHTSGDLLLRQIARRLDRSAATGCAVYRFDGDEFMILAEPGLSTDELHQLAERILESISNPISFGNRDLLVTASIGIACWSADDADGNRLIRRANTALLDAKLTRDTYRLHDPDSRQKQCQLELRIESDLEAALRDGEFLLYYQPRYELRTGRLAAVEATVRWRHPELGLLAPEAFMPAAERTGFILPLGEWALSTVCRQLLDWDESGFGISTVSIGLSPVQLQQQNLNERLCELTLQCGIDIRRIELELSERCLLHHPNQSAAAVQKLASCGPRLTLANFGAGQSALGHLRTLPFTLLKLDASCIARARTDEGEQSIIRAIIAIAHQCGMTVAAEGAESAGQLTLLKDSGCDLASGHVYAAPATAEELTRKLRLAGLGAP